MPLRELSQDLPHEKPRLIFREGHHAGDDSGAPLRIAWTERPKQHAALVGEKNERRARNVNGLRTRQALTPTVTGDRVSISRTVRAAMTIGCLKGVTMSCAIRISANESR
jgi:hypothetical protein